MKLVKLKTRKTCISHASRSSFFCASPSPTPLLKCDIPQGGVCVLDSKRSTVLVPLTVIWSEDTLRIRVGRP